MINDIYNQRILELAGNIPRLGRLKNPDASAKAHSRLCGSTVTIDLCVNDGRVVDFAHDVKACALGQASSSLMARHIIGATPEELIALRDRATRRQSRGAHDAGAVSRAALRAAICANASTTASKVNKVEAWRAL